MKPWVSLAASPAPDGTVLELCQRGHEYVIRAGGRILMGSHRPGSERAMAELTLDALPNERKVAANVLVGGLGCGFTLRATLDQLGAEARVTVSELLPAVVEWNRGPMGECSGLPVGDNRVQVVIGDIKQLLLRERQTFDAIMLDVDNGPQAFTQQSNAWLYSKCGLDASRRALRSRGVLSVWSAGPNEAFSTRLRAAGFDIRCHTVRSSNARRGERHTVWVAVKETRVDFDESA